MADNMSTGLFLAGFAVIFTAIFVLLILLITAKPGKKSKWVFAFLGSLIMFVVWLVFFVSFLNIHLTDFIVK